MSICELYYLYKENDEKIEVGYPSELLKQIFRDKIPDCVLKEKERKQHLRQRQPKKKTGYLSRFHEKFYNEHHELVVKGCAVNVLYTAAV